jgi:hypothetical protein
MSRPMLHADTCRKLEELGWTRNEDGDFMWKHEEARPNLPGNIIDELLVACYRLYTDGSWRYKVEDNTMTQEYTKEEIAANREAMDANHGMDVEEMAAQNGEWDQVEHTTNKEEGTMGITKRQKAVATSGMIAGYLTEKGVAASKAAGRGTAVAARWTRTTGAPAVKTAAKVTYKEGRAAGSTFLASWKAGYKIEKAKRAARKAQKDSQ